MVPVLEASRVKRIEVTETPEQPATIVLATDGTAQSDHAVQLARVISARKNASVRVLTVVDQLPMPWGPLDSAIAAEYDRGLQTEALNAATRQVSSLGDRKWPVEAKAGDPAETITRNARDCDAKFVMVGLGGHGAVSRVFGSETALRLARVSETPVLAVEPHLTDLPRRILVAMDFSEASIEAARLALEIADDSGSMVLAHVVPWKPSPCVPAEWIRTEEESVTAQLRRVIGWLNPKLRFRIGQRILYGRPGPALLKYAEELDVDLIATGTHGRTAEKRLLGGQTVDKMIRGARCSVLVFPGAAAFHASVAGAGVTAKSMIQNAG